MADQQAQAHVLQAESDHSDAENTSSLDAVNAANTATDSLTEAIASNLAITRQSEGESLGLEIIEGADMTRVTTPAAFPERQSPVPSNVDLTAPVAHGEKFMGKKERRNSSAFKVGVLVECANIQTYKQTIQS
jgi:hypothetical protein